MSAPLIPRPTVLAALRARAEGKSPVALTGPPGAGKTTLLLELRRTLEDQGFAVCYLDLMGAASSPDRFVASAIGALPAQHFGDKVREAAELRRRLDAGRAHHAEAVKGLFSLWASLTGSGGRPAVILLDEVTEIRSLAYFPGLRQVEALLAGALRARKGGTVVATSFPTLARTSFPFEALSVPPFTDDEASSAGVVACTFGWARYVHVMRERLRDGSTLRDAWTQEMARGGRLESACHHTYETLLLRSRGYGICKAALDAVARDEGANLKALVGSLGRTPGATRDYLQWLVGVDALRMEKKRYHYVDGLVRVWVRLHARGIPATGQDLARAFDDLASSAPAPAETETPAGEPTAEPEAYRPSPARRDTLMEID